MFGDRVSKAWIAGGGLVVAAVLGVLVGIGKWPLALAVLAPAGIALMLDAPLLAVAATILTGSGTIFAYAWPLISVGSISLYGSEVVLFALVLVAALIAVRESGWTSRLRDASTVILAVFLLAALVGVLVGAMSGADRQDLFSGFRPMVFLLVYFVVRIHAKDLQRLRSVLLVLAGICVFVVVMQIAQIALGASVPVIIVGDFKDLVNPDLATGFLRVRPPGLFLVYAGACVSAVYVLFGPRSRRWMAVMLFAVLAAGVLLSFNRHMLIGLGVGVLTAAIVSPGRRRLTGLLAVGVVMLLTLLIVMQFAGSQNVVVQRVSTLGDPKAQYDALSDRFYENGLALTAIQSAPVFGIGWGTQYGASATRLWQGVVASRNREYIHNQYLAAWMRTGLVGLAAFVGLFVVGLRNGVRWARSSEDRDRWLGLAVVAALAAFASSSLVDMVLLSPSNNAVFVGLVAVSASLEMFTREAKQSEADSVGERAA